MREEYNIDLQAGFDQLKTRIERRQRIRKLRMIWWWVLLAVMSIAAANYIKHWL